MTPPLLTRTFVLAWFANALLNLAGFLFVHLPGFLQQLGAGEAQIGRTMAAQAADAIAAWPLAGRAMDARGRRVVIRAGVALFVVVVGFCSRSGWRRSRFLSGWPRSSPS